MKFLKNFVWCDSATWYLHFTIGQKKAGCTIEEYKQFTAGLLDLEMARGVWSLEGDVVAHQNVRDLVQGGQVPAQHTVLITAPALVRTC